MLKGMTPFAGIARLSRFALAPLAAFALTILYTLPASAELSVPSFKELIETSDLIIVGTVASIVPALSFYVDFLILGAAFSAIGTILSWRRLKTRQRISLAATGFFILGILSGFVLGLGYSGYRRVAAISVSEVLKGNPRTQKVWVYFDNAIYLDSSEFERKKDYVLFLRLHESKHLLPWYHWAQWEVTPRGVTTKGLLSMQVPPKPLPDFLERIRGILEDPTNPQYAGIWKKGRWENTYYPIKWDPFFNPKARRAGEDANEPDRGDEK